MHRASSITCLALVLVAHAAAATAGSPRGGAKPRAERRPNEAVFRDLDRSVKSVNAGTALTRAFKVPRGKSGKKADRAYTLKVHDATLAEPTRTGRPATVKVHQRHDRSIKSSLIRLPSRSQPGSELLILNSYNRIEVTLRDPKRGEIRAEVDLDETILTPGSVRYYTMPPGDSMRTRKPVSLADATAFLDRMGGFDPARGTRASRVVADFTRRLEKSAAGMNPAERQRLAPLLALLTSTQAPARSSRPARAVGTAAAPAPRRAAVRRSDPHPNAPLFEQARQSLRVAAQGTALSRRERVAAAAGQRAYSFRARKATLRQSGKHGASSLHIEHNTDHRFRPIAARVSVPGTSRRGARLELAYTPHRMKIQLTDNRRGTLQIELDNDVDKPGGVRYSVVDLAGSGQAAPISPAQALDFVRDIGGFDPSPGVRATRAVSDLAARLDRNARRMTPTQRAELAPLIAALGGSQQSR